MEFNPNPTENSVSTEDSVEESLNSITTESFANMKKEFESSTLFEILNMTSTLDDPNDQFAISDDDVFLLNEEEDEDELSLQTDEK